jgi:membrane-bound ClpP family serine protease
VSLTDVAGVAGVALILVAFAGVQFQRLDPLNAPALLLNFFGAALVLLSLVFDFNLAAFVMESAWCLIALWGLGRIAFRRR